MFWNTLLKQSYVSVFIAFTEILPDLCYYHAINPVLSCYYQDIIIYYYYYYHYYIILDFTGVLLVWHIDTDTLNHHLSIWDWKLVFDLGNSRSQSSCSGAFDCMT